MGKIVIIIEDGPGGIAVKAAMDPKPTKDQPLTMAQKLGAFLIETVQTAAVGAGGTVLAGLDAKVHMDKIGRKVDEPAKPSVQRDDVPRRGMRRARRA